MLGRPCTPPQPEQIVTRELWSHIFRNLGKPKLGSFIVSAILCLQTLRPRKRSLRDEGTRGNPEPPSPESRPTPVSYDSLLCCMTVGIDSLGLSRASGPAARVLICAPLLAQRPWQISQPLAASCFVYQMMKMVTACLMCHRENQRVAPAGRVLCW